MQHIVSVEPLSFFFIVIKLDLFVVRKRVIGLSCEPNSQLNVYATSVTEGEVACVKLV